MSTRHTTRAIAATTLLFVSACYHRCGVSAAAVDTELFYQADIMLADFSTVERQGSAWSLTGTAVAANTILPAASVRERFVAETDHCVVFEGVTEWRSEEGLPSFSMMSSIQLVEAMWDAGSQRYVLSGLVPTAAFDYTEDELVITGPDGNVLTRVQAPVAYSNMAQLIGEPEGLRTSVFAPTGEYDQIVVFAADGGGPGGQSGVMCGYLPEDTTEQAPFDVVALVDDDAIAELEDRGIMPTVVNVAYHNAEITEDVFDEPITVHAGRMITVAASDLGL